MICNILLIVEYRGGHVIFMSQPNELKLYPLYTVPQPPMSQPNELKPYPPPYTVQPPLELWGDVETESGQSDTMAFNTGLDCRDIFLGKPSCVICGETGTAILDRCCIIGHLDITTVCPMCN
jgi:hypothetical protein